MSGVQAGDKVWLYTAIDGERQHLVKGEPFIYKKTGLPKMIPNDVNRVPELWNVKDQDTLYYLERVFDTTTILENIIDINNFPEYHTAKGNKLMESLK